VGWNYSFLLFASLTVHVFLLRNKPKLSYAIAYTIALFLLAYKIGEYIYWQAIGEHMKIPVEFSALSYFTFAITVIFRTKKADQFGSFVGLLTGLLNVLRKFLGIPTKFFIGYRNDFSVYHGVNQSPYSLLCGNAYVV
jgi:hypothetical protein